MDEFVGRFWVILNCTNYYCCHSQRFDPRELVMRCGTGFPVDRFEQRCRCTKCGARGALITISPPRRPDGADRFPEVFSPAKRQAQPED
jgi:hypothetical protein